MSSIFDEPEPEPDGPGCLSFLGAAGCAVPGLWIVLAFGLARMEWVALCCAAGAGLAGVLYVRRQPSVRWRRALVALLAVGPAVAMGVLVVVSLWQDDATTSLSTRSSTLFLRGRLFGRVEHMFDRDVAANGGATTAAAIRRVAAALAVWTPGDNADDAELLDRIRALEELKATASAAQARLTSAFAASRQARLAITAPELTRERVRRDVGAQVGLARRVSPRVGARLVGLAAVLTTEMPHTMAALTDGRIDEYQALLLVSETATLTGAHRRAVDAELAGRLGTLSAREARGAAARIGYRLDPAQAVARVRKAESERRVTIRPAPDTMTYVTALLPAVQGVAVHAALTRDAATATAAGDPRGTGAIMADTFVARVLQPVGTLNPVPAARSTAGTGDADLGGLPSSVAVEIQLVMTDRTLFDGDDEPAVLTGYGPIPAPLARRLVTEADRATRMWVRRLYAESESGELIGGDLRRRLFNHAERQFLVARDQTCRTPWCDAPIRHADHVLPHARGAPPPSRTAPGCAPTATRSRKVRDGRQKRTSTAASPRPRRAGTATAACRHRHPGLQPGWTSRTRGPPVRSTRGRPASAGAVATAGGVRTGGAGLHRHELRALWAVDRNGVTEWCSTTAVATAITAKPI